MTDNLRGALYMMVAMAAFTVNDVLIKLAGQQVPLFQAILVRGVITSLLIALLAWHRGALAVPIGARDRGVIAWRTVGETGATIAFLTALFHMPIANLTAILQVLPLAVTLAGALFLAEPVGWRRLTAILVGFAGVLLIVRPGPSGFDTYAILGVISVLFVVLRDLSTRRLSPSVPSLAVALITAVAITSVGVIGTIATGWQPLQARSLLLLTGASAFIVVGYLFAVMVMRVGEIAVVTPFRYTGLLWAMLLGFLVFGEFPGPLTFAGAALIVATGLFAFHRERVTARR